MARSRGPVATQADPARDGVLGILAGKGNLPYMAARNALAAGEDVRIFYYTSEEPPEDLRSISTRVVLIRLFTSVRKKMLAAGVKRLLLLGKAERGELYGNRPWSFDWRVLFLLARSVNQSDYSIFETLSHAFSDKGIEIISQATHLQDQFLPPGRYGRKCSSIEVEDVSFGMFFAAEMNRLDVGQSVVVGKKSVLAVEGAEGTDLCIRRGGELFHKKGAVVCKTGKTDHDVRFDIPVTGLSTLESMRDSGCRVLAIESARAFVLDPPAFVATAKRYGITIVSLETDRTSPADVRQLNRRAGRLPG